MSVVKPKPKQLLQPITTDANSAMSQSEYETITCSWGKARENARVQAVIGIAFASHLLKKWCEFCWPITKQSNVKPKRTQFAFDTQLKPLYAANSRSALLETSRNISPSKRFNEDVSRAEVITSPPKSFSNYPKTVLLPRWTERDSWTPGLITIYFPVSWIAWRLNNACVRHETWRIGMAGINARVADQLLGSTDFLFFDWLSSCKNHTTKEKDLTSWSLVI